MAAAQPKCPNCGAPPAPGSPLPLPLVCAYCKTPYAASLNRARPSLSGSARPTAGKATGILGGFAVVVLAAALVVLLRGGDGETRKGGQPMGSAAAHHQVLGESTQPRGTSSSASEGLYAPSPSAPSKQPTQPASAKFVFHGTRLGYKSSFYVLGEVENTSPFTIGKPELVVVLFDHSGKELTTDSGFATKEYLEPGQKSYVNALVKDPPPHDSMKFEVVARRATYLPKLAQGLRILDAQVSTESWGGYKFIGKVENGGSVAAKFLHVEVFAFDGAGKLLGVASGYAKTDRLEPGQAARYQLTSPRYDRSPSRFETTVTGRIAE